MAKPRAAAIPAMPGKAPTGISGLDEITGGGLPGMRTTLLVGGPGSGKTILGLQFLVHGAKHCKEPGIFVAFEEASKRIIGNAESFGWNLGALRPKKIFFMDAQPKPGLIQTGDFDINGMLAALEVQAREMRARRIVFDALDIPLALLPDAAAQRREVYRLNDWLLARKLTGVITLKALGEQGRFRSPQPFDFMQFMADCIVILDHRVEKGISMRALRVQKYRGSAFDENDAAFVIGASGFEVPIARTIEHAGAKPSDERISSGVTRLDAMLDGGYRRGDSVLITGFSGTAKTTLGGAFVEAACARGERSLFVTFDSNPSESVRNLASVGIRLDRHLKNGRLRLVSARAITGSAETYLARIKALVSEQQARCVLIDPVSTWHQSGDDRTTRSVADRLIDWAKARGITMLFTSLFDEMSSQSEGGVALPISSLVDTWIGLTYLLRAGERNRGLAVLKSRGTAHSNQVRELILSAAGVTLADAYAARGEALMGTLRWEREHAQRGAGAQAEAAERLDRIRVEAEEADLAVRVKSLQAALDAKGREKTLLVRTAGNREQESAHEHARIRELRGADPPIARRK
jgi:circadian clock protein KaiC